VLVTGCARAESGATGARSSSLPESRAGDRTWWEPRYLPDIQVTMMLPERHGAVGEAGAEDQMLGSGRRWDGGGRD
jgi:hypothetical protein